MRILITGAGSGIGHDSALELAKRGHDVLATTKAEDQATELKREAEGLGVKLTARKLDVTLETDVDTLRDDEFDVILSNAGVGESGPLVEIPFDRVERLFNVNVLGGLRVVQATVPKMIAKKSGRVILVSSLAGRIVIPYLGMYNMTKFSVEAMGDALRLELKRFGVKVSLIEPGLIGTGFNERMASTKYEWLTPMSAFVADIKKMKEHDAALTAASYSTKPVVDAIVHAVESPRPKIRYVAPSSYRWSVGSFASIPDWLKDRVAGWIAGL